MEDQRLRRGLLEAHAARRPRYSRSLAASRPAPAPPLHAVGPQRVQLAHVRVTALPVDAHRFDIGIAGEQQVRRHALEETPRRPGADWAARSDRAADGRNAPPRPPATSKRRRRRFRRSAAPRGARWRCADSPRASAPHNRAASSAPARRSRCGDQAGRARIASAPGAEQRFRASNTGVLSSRRASARAAACGDRSSLVQRAMARTRALRIHDHVTVDRHDVPAGQTAAGIAVMHQPVVPPARLISTITWPLRAATMPGAGAVRGNFRTQL